AQQGLLRRGVTGGLGPHQPFDEVPVMGDGQQLVLRRDLGERGPDASTPTYASTHPVRPQRHARPFQIRVVCPHSPAEFPRPRSSCPSTMIPAPTPVPRLTETNWRKRRPAPNHSSPVASAISGLSIRIGTGTACSRVSLSGTSRQFQLGAK